MAENKFIIERLAGIRKQLMAVHSASGPMSSASKGREREGFINNFLSEVFPKIFRFGTGDVTDKNGFKSGQLDVVVEYPFSPSLPLVGGKEERLYLAESIAAVLEVKSDISKQWNEAVSTANKLYPIDRSFGATMLMGPQFQKIPLFIVSYTGWNSVEIIKEKLSSTKAISGVLVIDAGLFVSANEFGNLITQGEWALWGLVYCLHLATGSLKAASTDPLEYAR